MTKLEAIATAKQFRKDADELLQRMKAHRRTLITPVVRPRPTIEELEAILSREGEKNVAIAPSGEVTTAHPNGNWGDDQAEVIAQHTLSIRDLESAIMRQGMVLKSIGTPNLYPASYDPTSSVVAPTADGLKL